MTDIATLGLAIDSRPIAAASAALDKLAASAKPAETALASLGAKSGPPMGAVEAAARRMGVTVEDQMSRIATASAGSGTAIGKMASATVPAAASMKGMSFEARNLGYQLVDVTQGALMGQSAFQIFAQQAGQIGQVIATSPQGLGGLVKELGRSFAGLFTPMRLLGVAGIAVAAAGYAINASWKSSALMFDDTARSVDTTITKLRSLEAAASIKGIDTDDFLKASEKLGANIYQARQNAGGLADVFRANGKVVTDYAGSLETAADLIKNATSNQQRLVLLQQMGLPATMQWVRFMSQGAEGVRAAADSAVTFGGAAENEMIAKARAFDEAWDRSWKNFGRSGQSAIVSIKAGISDLIVEAGRLYTRLNPNAMLTPGIRVDAGFMDLGQYSNPGLQTALEKRAAQMRGEGSTSDPEALRKSLSLEQQRISILGQSASVQQQVRLVEIQVQQARLNGVKITGTELANLKALAEQQALGITAIRSQADAYKIEADTVGMSVGKAAEYAAMQNAINEAKRSGRVLTDDQVAALQREATALGEAAARADNVRFQYDTFSGTLKDVASNLRNGQNLWQSFGNAAANALTRIGDKLIDMAAQDLWTKAFGGSGSGIGGFLSNLFGGGGDAKAGAGAGDMSSWFAHSGGIAGSGEGNGKRYIHPAYYENAPRFHDGKLPWNPSFEMPAIIRQDEGVFTPQQMKALGAGRGGSPISLTVADNRTISIGSGADKETVRQVQQMLDDDRRRRPTEIVQVVQNARSRRVL